MLSVMRSLSVMCVLSVCAECDALAECDVCAECDALAECAVCAECDALAECDAHADRVPLTAFSLSLLALLLMASLSRLDPLGKVRMKSSSNSISSTGSQCSISSVASSLAVGYIICKTCTHT